jgi:hypothetical protein
MQRFAAAANRPNFTNIEDGAMFDNSGADFSLSYSNTQRLACSHARIALPPVLASYGFDGKQAGCLDKKLESRRGDVDVSMTVSIPGALAGHWLDAPGERDVQFFPVYARVSRAVQRAIRAWLPYLYFSRPERYEDLESAAPLVVYQASRPCTGRPKYDFTYDVLREKSMSAFYRQASGRLAGELARIEELLLGAARRDAAAAYSPKHTKAFMGMVQRHPAQVRSLLVADTCLIDAFVNLGCRAGQLHRSTAKDPGTAVREFARLGTQAAKALRSKLRRLYGGQEFLALGSLLLVEATNALSGNPSVIQATIHISASENGQPDAMALTLVNAAWQSGPG